MAGLLFNVFFSPTHTTEALAVKIADTIAEEGGYALRTVNLTRQENRPAPLTSDAKDMLLFSFPVYGGRIPVVLQESIAQLHGEGTRAALVAVYGNRNFDDALLEAADLLTDRGFVIAAAGAFIAEHSMAPTVATGRPDVSDLARAAQFGRDVAQRIKEPAGEMPLIKGNRPYRDGMPPTDIRPSTTDDCTACGICVSVCPLGIIDASDPAQIEAGCLQCRVCVKQCPHQAKYFDDEQSRRVVAMLESACTARKEPELFF